MLQNNVCIFIPRLSRGGRPASNSTAKPGYRARWRWRKQKGGREKPRARLNNTSESKVEYNKKKKTD